MAIPGNQILAFGAVLSVGRNAERWCLEVMRLDRQVYSMTGSEKPLMRVNVNFMIEGNRMPVSFEGLRTGSFFKNTNSQVVQVAVKNPAATVDLDFIADSVFRAIDLAEELGIRRKRIAEPLDVNRRFAAEALSTWKSTVE